MHRGQTPGSPLLRSKVGQVAGLPVVVAALDLGRCPRARWPPRARGSPAVPDQRNGRDGDQHHDDDGRQAQRDPVRGGAPRPPARPAPSHQPPPNPSPRPPRAAAGQREGRAEDSIRWFCRGRDRGLAPVGVYVLADVATARPPLKIPRRMRTGRGQRVAARRARSTTSRMTRPRASTSRLVEVWPREKRSEPRARESSAPMASST